MWFPRWFGRRGKIEDTDEPASFAPPEALRTGPRTARKVSRPDRAAISALPAAGKKGFDPYNSGAFERRNAWERVGRR